MASLPPVPADWENLDRVVCPGKDRRIGAMDREKGLITLLDSTVSFPWTAVTRNYGAAARRSWKTRKDYLARSAKAKHSRTKIALDEDVADALYALRTARVLGDFTKAVNHWARRELDRLKKKEGI